MASLLVAAGVLTYDRQVATPIFQYLAIQKTRTKRRERKEENAARFSELEKDNAQRMAWLQNRSTPAQGSDEAIAKGRQGSSSSEQSRRSSLAEEGPPPPAYEEAVRDRMASKGGGEVER
ncbi:MAG: hypothetical protein HETSPECPRED_000596 [Heterodermia speciosa]|uniref:Uncharacterized protein n=1 Tax=Heterodermia speciosa TaxID=116794 RepID=A0A8H3GAH2_9LECA|nr:MAG: hypothetical protein HETSPECPRED_000596 [Heterodermia speciosa]